MKNRRNRLVSLLLAASMLTTSVAPNAGMLTAYAETETTEAAVQNTAEADETAAKEAAEKAAAEAEEKARLESEAAAKAAQEAAESEAAAKAAAEEKARLESEAAAKAAAEEKARLESEAAAKAAAEEKARLESEAAAKAAQEAAESEAAAKAAQEAAESEAAAKAAQEAAESEAAAKAAQEAAESEAAAKAAESEAAAKAAQEAAESEAAAKAAQEAAESEAAAKAAQAVETETAAQTELYFEENETASAADTAQAAAEETETVPAAEIQTEAATETATEVTTEAATESVAEEETEDVFEYEEETEDADSQEMADAEPKVYDLTSEAFNGWIDTGKTHLYINGVDIKQATEIPDSSTFGLDLVFKVPSTATAGVFEGLNSADQIVYPVPEWVRSLNETRGVLMVGTDQAGSWQLEEIDGNLYFVFSYNEEFLDKNHRFGIEQSVHIEGVVDVTYKEYDQKKTISFPGIGDFPLTIVSADEIANIEINKALTGRTNPDANNDTYVTYEITVFAGKHDDNGKTSHNTVALNDVTVTDIFTAYEKGAWLNEAKYFENKKLLEYITYNPNDVTYKITNGFGKDVTSERTNTSRNLSENSKVVNGAYVFATDTLKPDETLTITYKVKIDHEMVQHDPRGHETGNYNSEPANSGDGRHSQDVSSAENTNRSWIDRMVNNAAKVETTKEDGTKGPDESVSSKEVTNRIASNQTADITFVHMWLWKNGSDKKNNIKVDPYTSYYEIAVNEGRDINYQNVSGWVLTDDLEATDIKQKFAGDITITWEIPGGGSGSDTLSLKNIQEGSVSGSWAGTTETKLVYTLGNGFNYKIAYLAERVEKSDGNAKNEFICKNGAMLTENGPDNDTYGVYETHTVKGATVTKRFLSKDVVAGTIDWQTTIDEGIPVQNGSVYYDYIGWTVPVLNADGTETDKRIKSAPGDSSTDHVIDTDILNVTITKKSGAAIDPSNYKVERLTQTDLTAAEQTEKTDGFKITFLTDMPDHESLLVTYTTKADFKNVVKSEEYTNACTYKWKIGTELKLNDGISDSATTSHEVKSVIHKAVEASNGEDAVSADIKWTITVNEAKDEIAQLKVVDELPAGLEMSRDTDVAVVWVENEDGTNLLNTDAAEKYRTLTFTETDDTLNWTNEEFNFTYTKNTRTVVAELKHTSKFKIGFDLVTRPTAEELQKIITSEDHTSDWYYNTADLYTDTDKEKNIELAHASAQAKRKVEVLSKSLAAYDEETAPYANYTIEVNKAVQDLNAGGDTLELVDSGMADNMFLIASKLKVKDGRSGNDLPADQYSLTVNADQHGFTLVVPDGKYLIVTYDVLVTGEVSTSTALTNNASLTGSETWLDEVEERDVKILQSNAGRVANKITIRKIEKRTTTENGTTVETEVPLKGAEFTIYEGQNVDDTKKLTNGVLKTNTNGVATNVTSTGSIPELKTYTATNEYVYTMVETKAPDGYKLPIGDDLPVYRFAFLDYTSTAEEINAFKANYPDFDIIYVNNEDFTYTVTNEPLVTKNIPVIKIWDDAHEKSGVDRGMIEVSLYRQDELNVPVDVINVWYNNTDEQGRWWTGVFENIPVYDEKDAPITYIVKEKVKSLSADQTDAQRQAEWEYISGIKEGYDLLESKSILTIQYDKDKDKFVTVGDTTQITDGFEIVNQFQTYLDGTKTWSADKNHESDRPSSITLKLQRRHSKKYENGAGPVDENGSWEDAKDADGNLIIQTVTASNKWSYQFDHLPKFDTKTGDANKGNASGTLYYMWEYRVVELLENTNSISVDQKIQNYMPSEAPKEQSSTTQNITNTRLSRKISGYLWEDTDRLGYQDDGEEAINNQEVQLWKQNESGKYELVADKTAKTDEYGKYSFDELEPGTYEVRIVRNEAVTRKTGDPNKNDPKQSKAVQSTEDNKLTAVIGKITLPDNDELRKKADALATDKLFDKSTGVYHMPNQDAGFVTYSRSFSGIAWQDENRNGIREEGDDQIEGVDVYLYKKVETEEGDVYELVKDNSGNPVKKTTDKNGAYTFTDLEEGETYRAYFDRNQGITEKTGTAGTDTVDQSKAVQEVITAEDGTKSLAATVSDIYMPTNYEMVVANEEKKKPEEERDADKKKYASDDDGNYNLPNQDAGFVSYSRSFGGITWLDAPETDGKFDQTEGSKDSVLKNTGITLYRYNEETKAYDIKVTKDADGNALPTATDDEGKYQFNHLEAGDYKVVFAEDRLVTEKSEVSTDDEIRSLAADDAHASGAYIEYIHMPSDVEIVEALAAKKAGETDADKVKYADLTDGNYNLPHQDAGFIEYNRTISGKAWFDNGGKNTNHDGSFDTENEDKGVEGVKVILLVKGEDGKYTPAKDADGKEITTTTDKDGNYTFTNLLEGTYSVIFENPDNQGLTDKEAKGVDSEKNSKADQKNENGTIRGEITEIVLPTDKEIREYILDKTTQKDAEFDEKTNTFERKNQNVGYIEYSRSYEGIAWLDKNRNGIREDSDEIMSGVTVRLYELVDGKYVAVTGEDGKAVTAVTDQNGAYRFDNLKGGTTYRSVFDVDQKVTKKAADDSNNGKDSKADQSQNVNDSSKLAAIVSDIYMPTNAEIAAAIAAAAEGKTGADVTYLPAGETGHYNLPHQDAGFVLPEETTPSTEPETTPSTEPETTPSTEPETKPSTEPETTPSTETETDDEEVTGSIVLKKIFKGAEVTAPAALRFIVKDADGEIVATVKYSQFKNGTYTVSDLELGEYTVTEEGGSISGYKLTASVDEDSVELTEDDPQAAVTFTNTYEKESGSDGGSSGGNVTKRSTSGVTSGKGTSGNVKTGDTTNLVFPIVTLVAALAVIAAILAFKRRKRA